MAVPTATAPRCMCIAVYTVMVLLLLLLWVPVSQGLVSVLDEALSPALQEKLLKESRKAHLWAMKQPGMQHNKRPTFWMDLQAGAQKPRCFAELAVLSLWRQAAENAGVSASTSVAAPKRIVGAEWWVQMREPRQGLGFHYDKDEAMASTQSRMRFPRLSTVTYLAGTGAPLMVLNQTTLNGNEQVPPIPTEAFFVYPEARRHILFSGNLNHGVAGSLSLEAERESELRISFVINWWAERAPEPPNCVTPSDDTLKEMGIYAPHRVSKHVRKHATALAAQKAKTVSQDGDGAADDDGTSYMYEYLRIASLEPDLQQYLRTPPAQPVTMLDQTLVVPRNKSSYEEHNVTFPPGDGFWFHMPRDMQRGAFSVKWKPFQVFGAVGLLDLQNENQVGHLFRSTVPVSLIFFRRSILSEVKSMVLPLAKRYQGRISTYLADVSLTQDAMRVFGLDHLIEGSAIAADKVGIRSPGTNSLPVAILHDVSTDEKRVMSESFTASNLEQFWNTWLSQHRPSGTAAAAAAAATGGGDGGGPWNHAHEL